MTTLAVVYTNGTMRFWTTISYDNHLCDFCIKMSVWWFSHQIIKRLPCFNSCLDSRGLFDTLRAFQHFHFLLWYDQFICLLLQKRTLFTCRLSRIICYYFPFIWHIYRLIFAGNIKIGANCDIVLSTDLWWLIYLSWLLLKKCNIWEIVYLITLLFSA